jgi:hypothetical protein
MTKQVWKDNLTLSVQNLYNFLFVIFKIDTRILSVYNQGYENGRNIRRVKPLIDHRKRGNAARIQMKKNINIKLL